MFYFIVRFCFGWTLLSSLVGVFPKWIHLDGIHLDGIHLGIFDELGYIFLSGLFEFSKIKKSKIKMEII